MILVGAKLLEQNRAKVDALNVFPVPDGDTGTNMSLTMQSAVTAGRGYSYVYGIGGQIAKSRHTLCTAKGFTLSSATFTWAGCTA